MLGCLLGVGAVSRPLQARADVTGYSGSPSISGWVGTQPDLLPTEVSDPAFGQRYDHAVNGNVYAQPLIADDGTGRRVLVAVTETNDAYGLSPDDASLEYWHQSSAFFGAPWVIAKSSDSTLKNCTDITPTIGSTSTPVVDPATRTVYLTVKTTDTSDSTGGTARYFVHALSLTDGSERAHFPVQLTGTADNDPSITFDPTHQLQRPGLLLLGGVVYMAFGGHCDAPHYDGWVIGVSAVGAGAPGVITARWADQKNSDGFGAGIWMAGSGLASDGPGQILLTTGNGTVPQANPQATVINGHSPPNNLGEAAVRLTVQSNGTLKATDFFSPKDNTTLNASDLDLGSSGITLLPDSFGTSQHPHVAVIGGKVPILRSLDLAALGGFDSGGDHVMGALSYAVDPSNQGGTWGRAAAWPGDGGWVYIVDMNDPVTSGTRGSGLVALQRSVDSSGNVQFVKRGTDPTADADWIQTSGSPTVTSNGTTPLTAVVWAVQAFGHNLNNARLLAFSPVPDAGGHLPLLWTGPALGRAGKFSSITVDQNHLYIGTRDGHIDGYWLSKVPDLSETPQWFGAQPVGYGSTATLSLTVRAGHAVTVTGVSSRDPQFAVGARTPADGTVLQPNGTLQVPVTFTPSALGDTRSTIRLSLDDGTTVAVGVGGTGRAAHAQLSASTGSVDLGNHATGTTTTTSFQLSNSGGDPLTIGTSTAGSVTAPFSVSGIPAAGTTVLQPGDTLPVSVTYAPTTATNGTPDTSGVTVNSDAGSVTVGFSGTATPPGVLAVADSPPANRVDAGDVVIGSSATLHFTVSNTGGTVISISRSKPPGGEFAAVTDLPEGTSIQPGVSKGVDVTFTPTAAGPASGTWQLNSDGQGGPRTVTFTGNGLAPAHLSAGAGTIDFGTRTAGTTTAGTLQLTNTGDASLTFQGSDAGSVGRPFSVSGVPAAGSVLAGHASVTLSATYAPVTAPSNDRAVLTVRSDAGSVTVTLSGSAVATVTPPAPFAGYWLAASDGGVFPFGDASGYGSTGGVHLNQPIVGLAATPSKHGYWLVAADGGVFPFGDAAGYGSTGGIRLTRPVVGLTPTSSGRGYWLVASDGGIFPFGDAVGHGSTGAIHLNQPIVGMAATSDGGGYWLVAADGGIFPFGDAIGRGSTGGLHLNSPVVGMAATADSAGYWLVAADGGIFPFGDAAGHGSTGGVRLARPMVGMAATPDGAGYWLVAADGGVFPFGDAAGMGSLGGTRLNRPVVTIAA